MRIRWKPIKRAIKEDQPFGQEAKAFFRKKVFKKKIKEKVYDKKDDNTLTLSGCSFMKFDIY
ncbi:MAG: hypothetical protein D3903_14210 [Candidatus Electrothrix sp. GM3_4]|nr:hypothetical protein [Candidatus Electrothrix sp. GM3_4]